MKILPLSFVIACAGLMTLPAISWAQEPMPGNGTSKAAGTSKLSEKDADFVKKAAQGGMLEVKVGELAKDKAASADVKAFGEKMVTDHTKANEDLKAVATAKGVTLSDDLMGMSKGMYDKMAKLSGADFDKMYVMDMVKDHKKDVADFEAESKSTKDPELKGFVDKTLPTLKEHLEMIEKMSKDMGGMKAKKK